MSEIENGEREPIARHAVDDVDTRTRNLWVNSKGRLTGHTLRREAITARQRRTNNSNNEWRV